MVGDTVYGAPRLERVDSQILPSLGRNFLHAARVGFSHPLTGKAIVVRAPLPAELVGYLHTLGEIVKVDRAVIDAALEEFL